MRNTIEEDWTILGFPTPLLTLQFKNLESAGVLAAPVLSGCTHRGAGRIAVLPTL